MNKSVLVTAGASGIGACIAAAFNEAGAGLHIVDLDTTPITSNEKFSSALLSVANVSKAHEVERVFSRHFEQFDGIDVLVNCAGIAGPTALVENTALADWQACFAVNIDATFLCSRQAIPAMKQKRAGRIINISSTAGWHGYPLRGAYCAAKWGVIGLTKTLAMELGQYGITANAICPGSVAGERMERVIAAEAKQKGISATQVRRNYTQSCSLRTFIAAQDIADMAIFLASDQAARVSGQIMNVDGHLENYGGIDD